MPLSQTLSKQRTAGHSQKNAAGSDSHWSWRLSWIRSFTRRLWSLRYVAPGSATELIPVSLQAADACRAVFACGRGSASPGSDELGLFELLGEIGGADHVRSSCDHSWDPHEWRHGQKHADDLFDLDGRSVAGEVHEPRDGRRVDGGERRDPDELIGLGVEAGDLVCRLVLVNGSLEAAEVAVGKLAQELDAVVSAHAHGESPPAASTEASRRPGASIAVSGEVARSVPPIGARSRCVDDQPARAESRFGALIM